MHIQTYMARPTFTGVFWGIVGGFLLITVTFFSTKGLIQVSPYPLILIAAILTIKYTNDSNKIFGRLFFTGLLTFIVMSLILYVYIAVYINPNSGITFKGHLWRFAAILGFGIASSSILSFIAKPVK